MRDTLPDRVRLGDFEVDLRAGEVRSGDRSVRLQEKSLRVLHILLEHRGELVSRDEIQRKLWPHGTIVDFENGINTAIKKLRQALDDSPERPRYVETIPRRGYRLAAAIEWLGADDSSGEVSGGADGTAVRLQPEPGLIGKKVSHYRVLEVIGGGGMGMLYKAEDLKLGRQVALKFLPEELASDPVALQRFEREARTASSLNHPNICTIHEVEEYQGQPFIVMELLEGETLRDRLAALAAGQKRPALYELLDIAIQICDGLEAAHRKGIIHRDIKPANIFLTTSDQVKILDFGLAKLVIGDQASAFSSPAEAPNQGQVLSSVILSEERSDESKDRYDREDLNEVPRLAAANSGPLARDETPKVADATLTRTGLAMGTAGYMSPEQVRGENLDVRTDIFSFGLVLYEMATGQRAFSGETAAVVQNAIVTNAPVAVRELNSMLPARLVTIIDKALEKDRERRYQSVAKMRGELEQVNAKPSMHLPARWKRYAVAALLITVVVAGSLYWRSRRTFKLTQKDTIVLAHVVNNTGDTVMDDALDLPLFRKLTESPYVTVLYASKVLDTLRLMKVSDISYTYMPQTPKLTPELAREVCVRSDSRAVVTAYIANTGNAYNIALNALDCHSGKTVARVEEQTNDRNQIVSTLGAAGHQLRRELGEPEDSLKKFNTPLENETSGSLEALQGLNQAERLRAEQGDAAALPQYKRVVELDSNLAVAYLNLVGIYSNFGERSSMVAAATKAFALRDRLSQRSRWFVEAGYYLVATGELGKANATFDQWEQTFPADVYAHRNRVSTLFRLGQLEEAAVEARDAVRLLPNIQTHEGLVQTLLFTNRLEEARVVLEEAKARGLDDLSLRSDAYLLAFLQGDNRAMQEQLSWAMGTPQGKAWALLQPGDRAIYHGRFRAAQNLYSVAQRSSHWPAASPPDEVLSHTALGDAETGNSGRARQAAEQALSAGPNSTNKRLVALILARAGAVDEAESIAKLLDHEFPLDTLLQNFELPALRAAIELQKGQPARAVEILQSALPYDFAFSADQFEMLYPAYLRGLAYLQLGRGREAAAEFQKMVDHPAITDDFITAPLSHLQLGRAQAMAGDKAAAGRSYQEFLTLWKDADPDIPIYKEAKVEYAKLQ
jgi:eukaryotic-like serine/threonine-protein kinase